MFESFDYFSIGALAITKHKTVGPWMLADGDMQ